MRVERIPGRRLITQNVLTSASLFERGESLDWVSIQNLSTFIDLFCLYDTAEVLGRGVEIMFGWSSDFFDLLQDENYIDNFHPYDIGGESIATAARKHLVAFLGEHETDKFHELLMYALSPGEVFRLEPIPDGVQEINIGKEWLITTPTHVKLLDQLKKEQDVIRGTTFLARTFLYYAYADVAKIAFTPDAARCPVLTTVLDKEQQFRGRLLSSLKSTWEEETPGDKDLLTRVSPFGSIVFKRACPNKKRIIPEMQKLRKELASLRTRLRDIEDRLLWRSRNEALTAHREWHGVLAEVEKNFGTEPQLVTLKRGLNFGEHVGDVIKSPTSLKSWAKTLFDVPAEIATRLIRRRPVVEIHRLKSELPATARLRNTIERLFGPIREM